MSLRAAWLLLLLGCRDEACLAVPDANECPDPDRAEAIFRGEDPSGPTVLDVATPYDDPDGLGVTCCYAVAPGGD